MTNWGKVWYKNGIIQSLTIVDIAVQSNTIYSFIAVNCLVLVCLFDFFFITFKQRVMILSKDWWTIFIKSKALKL